MFEKIKAFVIYWQILFYLGFFIWLGLDFTLAAWQMPQELRQGTLGAIGNLKDEMLAIQSDCQGQLDATNKKADLYYNDLLYNISDIRKSLNLPPQPPPKIPPRVIPSQGWD